MPIPENSKSKTLSSNGWQCALPEMIIGRDSLLEIPKESITPISLNASTSSLTRVSRQKPWNWERERLWRQNLWRQKSKSQWICTNSWWTKGPIWTQGHKLWVLRILGRSRSCPSCRIHLGPWWRKWIGRLGLELPRRRFRHKRSTDWALVLVGPWIVHWVYYYTLPGIKGSSNMQYQITQNLCLGTRT